MNKYIAFGVLFTTGIGVFLLQRLQVPLPYFVNSFLNDILIIPIVSYIGLFVMQFFKGNTYRLPWIAVMLLCIYYSVYFEWYLPTKMARYTGDVLDVICYFSGGFLFIFLQKLQISFSQKRFSE